MNQSRNLSGSWWQCREWHRSDVVSLESLSGEIIFEAIIGEGPALGARDVDSCTKSGADFQEKMGVWVAWFASDLQFCIACWSLMHCSCNWRQFEAFQNSRVYFLISMRGHNHGGCWAGMFPFLSMPRLGRPIEEPLFHRHKYIVTHSWQPGVKATCRQSDLLVDLYLNSFLSSEI